MNPKKNSQETTVNAVNRSSRTASGRPDTNKSQTKSKKSSLSPIDNSIYDGVASNEGMNKPVTSPRGKEIIEKILRKIFSKQNEMMRDVDKRAILKALTLAEKDFNKKVEELKKEIEKRRIPMKLGNTDQNTSRINAHLYEIIELINEIFGKNAEEKGK